MLYALIALVLGILAHICLKMTGARQKAGWAGPVAYLKTFAPDIGVGVFCAGGLFLALPELSRLIPALGDVDESRILAFLCGYCGSDLTLALSQRFVRAAGGP